MKTRSNDGTRNQAGARGFTKGVSVVTLCIVILAGAMGIGTAPARGAETTLLGQNNPAVDYDAVQNAVDHYDIVNLQGTFDFTHMTVTKGPLMITRDVMIRGEEPTGSFTPDQKNWVDERYWPTKIFLNNVHQGNTMKIDNPDGIVELINLSITSGSQVAVLVGDFNPSGPRGACRDLHVRNCKIVTTHGSGACMETWGGLTGTCYLEGCSITGPYCINEWASWKGFRGNSKWEIHSNTLIATWRGCIYAGGSRGLRMENNQWEGQSILYCPFTQGEIVIKNNTMIQSGHFRYIGLNVAYGLCASHQGGFNGGEISENLIQMNPSQNVSFSSPPSVAIMLSTGSAAARGLLVQDNAIMGKAEFGIVLDYGASDNIIRRNNLEGFTATQFGNLGAAQVWLTDDCQDNLFRDNVIGPLGSGAWAGIYCEGDNNDIIRNDYTKSGILGLTAGDIPCVILGPDSERNLVFEPDGFPPGTTAADQVLDESCSGAGTTTNIVVMSIGQSLLAHWKLDEEAGTIAYDSAGENDAFLMGDPIWQPDAGKVGGALDLDGVDDWAFTSSIKILGSEPVSALAWIKGGGPNQAVLSQPLAGGWLMVDTEGRLMTELGDAGPSGEPLASGIIITDGEWHQIGVVLDGEHRKLYVDSVIMAEDSLAGSGASTSSFNIGVGKGYLPGTCWSGLIDDIRIYNRVVTP